jgi:putative membrane protein
MLGVNALHICFMVRWFAGVGYLPRLFGFHALSPDALSRERFKLMERKLYWGIMTPGGVLALFFGLWLWLGWGFGGTWLHAKLALAALLVVYHLWCGKLMRDFSGERNRRSHVWFRWFNELPVLVLIAAVFLAVFQPA